MNKSTTLYPIAYRGLSSNSLVTISANIEKSINNNIAFVSDVIFLTFKAGKRANGKTIYDKNNEISAKINSIELRALAYGIRNALKKVANNNFSKEEKLYYNRTANSEYFISATEDKKVYLNAKEIKKSNFVGVEIEIFEFLSFATSLEQIANITEENLYTFQRRLKQGEKDCFLNI